MKDNNYEELLSFDDVLLVPQYSDIASRSEVRLHTTLSHTKEFLLDIPIISSNMDTVTETDMAIAVAQEGGLGIIHRFLDSDKQVAMVKAVKEAGFRVGAAIGVKNGEQERAEALADAGVDVITVDIAHGHSRYAMEHIQRIKQQFPHIMIIGGNVATAEGFSDLAKAGADAIKVGIGPGSICTTRVVTGFGVPQFSAIQACAPVAQETGVGLIADGGIRASGDIVKAMAAGADAVMIGNVLAGTDEAPGDWMMVDGRKYKTYRGMASLQANLARPDNEKKRNEIIAEGVSGLVPYKGSAHEVIQTMVGGIRSGLSYAGARNFKELREKARFIRITPGGLRESGFHDIYVS